MNELFTTSEMRSAPTPLVMARRRLAELQSRAESMVIQAKEDGSEGELEASDEWRELRRQLKQAAGTVAAEEQIELSRNNP